MSLSPVEMGREVLYAYFRKSHPITAGKMVAFLNEISTLKKDKNYSSRLVDVLEKISTELSKQDCAQKTDLKSYLSSKYLKDTSFKTLKEFADHATVQECDQAVERIKKLTQKIDKGTFNCQEDKIAKRKLTFLPLNNVLRKHPDLIDFFNEKHDEESLC